MDTPPNPPIKRLVLVVHGIGEQNPGETLDQLVGAATGNQASSVQSEKRLLRDVHDNQDPRALDLFDCELRRVETQASTLVFAEVFWADLSRGRVGQLATLYELVMGILGLGHLVRESAEEQHPGPKGHWLRSLANLLVATLHGPVAVLNLLLVAGVAFVYASGTFMPESLATHAAVAVLAAAAIAGGFWARKRTDSYLFAIFANWLFWLGIAVAMLVVATVSFNPDTVLPFSPPEVECSNPMDCQLVWYGLAFIGPLNLVWLLLLAGVLTVVTGQGLHDLSDKTPDSRSLYAVLCAVMAVFWLVVASAFWASLSAFMGELPVETKVTAQLLQAGISLITPALIAFAIIVVVAGLCWLKRARWSKSHNKDNFNNTPPPRLIFNVNVRRAFVFAVVLLGAAAVAITYVNLAGKEHRPDWIFDIFSTLYPYALGIAVAVGLLYPFAWSQLAEGLGIAKDIITYFKGEPSVRNSTRPEYPLRARMHHRFVVVMETMIASEEPDEVIVISHSQGTVIAIEAIRGNNTSMLFDKERIKKRALITMGSPYSHIYEHYFPSRFTLPDDFDKRLDHWINIFRIDDFVGTFVGPTDGKWPLNVPVNPRGHTGYWTDGEVLKVLVDKVFPELA